jgi:glycosyltransferase involved in cell wall biosynthesis
MPVAVSICLCTRDRAGALRETLEALLASVRPSESIEVLVVDNASVDETSEVVAEVARRDNRVRYLYEPYPGAGRARNTAIRHAEGAMLAFLDDDVRPQPGWLFSITKPLARGEADAVAGRIVLAPELERQWLTDSLRLMLAQTPCPRDEQPTLISANIAVTREMARALPFDEELGPGQLGLGEDLLFTLQARAAGFRLVTEESAVVVHHLDASRLERRSLIDHAERSGRSDAYIWRHWLHSELGWIRIRIIRAQLGLVRMKLSARRRMYFTEVEYVAFHRLAFLRQLRLERRRPARYPPPDSRHAISATRS